MPLAPGFYLRYVMIERARQLKDEARSGDSYKLRHSRYPVDHTILTHACTLIPLHYIIIYILSNVSP